MGDPSPDIKNENTTPKTQNSLESLNSILAFQVQDLIDKKLDKAESGYVIITWINGRYGDV